MLYCSLSHMRRSAPCPDSSSDGASLLHRPASQDSRNCRAQTTPRSTCTHAIGPVLNHTMLRLLLSFVSHVHHGHSTASKALTRKSARGHSVLSPRTVVTDCLLYGCPRLLAGVSTGLLHRLLFDLCGQRSPARYPWLSGSLPRLTRSRLIPSTLWFRQRD